MADARPGFVPVPDDRVQRFPDSKLDSGDQRHGQDEGHGDRPGEFQPPAPMRIILGI